MAYHVCTFMDRKHLIQYPTDVEVFVKRV